MIGKTPTGPLRRHVRQMTRPYSLDRELPRDDMTPGGGKQYETDAVAVDLYLYGEQGGERIDVVGELQTGNMQAVCLAEADVQVGDRLDYAGRTYEVVEPIQLIPDQDNPAIKQLPLDRVPEQAR